eukprot:138182_1
MINNLNHHMYMMALYLIMCSIPLINAYDACTNGLTSPPILSWIPDPLYLIILSGNHIMSILSSSFLHRFNKDEKPFTPLVRNNEKHKFLFSKTILFFWALTGHFGALIHVTKRFESISRIWGISNIFIFITFCIITVEFTIKRDSATFASVTQLLLWITNDIWCFCGLIVNIWHFKFTCLCGKVEIEYNGFKNYITFRNNIHQLNSYKNKTNYDRNDRWHIHFMSQKELLLYVIILFISILLLNLLPFNDRWCEETTHHNYDSIIFQSIVTIWNNICSLYAFDVTLLYVCLLHIQRFRNFRKQIIQNASENNIYIVRKEYYESIVKNMKISKHNWEFWVNGSFLFNSLYVSFVIGIWMTDKTQLWTWCHTNPVQISFVAGLSIIRIMALVYPIARINTEFHKINQTLQKYVGWDTNDEIQIDHIYAMKKLKLFKNLSKKYSINE